MAIWSVQWHVAGGASGAAPMSWHISSGSYKTRWVAQTDWTAGDIPLHRGVNIVTVTAVDIKGLSTSRAFKVTVP
jgi:hypothetical protein